MENLGARNPIIVSLEFSRYPQPIVFPDLKSLYPDTVPQPNRDEELILHLLIRKGTLDRACLLGVSPVKISLTSLLSLIPAQIRFIACRPQRSGCCGSTGPIRARSAAKGNARRLSHARIMMVALELT